MSATYIIHEAWEKGLIKIVKDAKYQWHTFRDTGRVVK